MKCYTIDYDLSQRAPKRVFVSRNSTYQIGIRVAEGDSSAEVLFIEFNDHTLNPSKDGFSGYRIFDLTSGDDPKVEDVKVAVEHGTGSEAHTAYLPLQLVTTSSTVAEVNPSVPEHESVTFSGEYADGTQFSYELLRK